MRCVAAAWPPWLLLLLQTLHHAPGFLVSGPGDAGDDEGLDDAAMILSFQGPPPRSLRRFAESRDRPRAPPGGKRSAVRPTFRAATSQFFFFTHTKADAVLMKHLSAVMASSLQEERVLQNANRVCGAMDEKCYLPCPEATVGFFANANARTLNHLLVECPRMRAVHVVRNPALTVSSSYVYHSMMGQQHPPRGHGPVEYGNMTLKEGLASEAALQVNQTLPTMNSTHETAMASSSSRRRVLTMGLEDFTADFDAASRRLFAHLLGAGHSLVDPLVAEAQRHDFLRWEKDKVREVMRIGNCTNVCMDPKEKNPLKVVQKRQEEVAGALQQLFKEGNKQVREAMSFQESLGYKYGSIWDSRRTAEDLQA